MDSITLNDLLNVSNSQDAKVKFNIWNGEVDPLDEYLYDPDIVNNQWLFWRTDKRNFKEGQIAICLVKVAWDIWLLTTVKRITKELNVRNGINYEGEELERYKKYFGRVLVKYHKDAQAMCQYYKSISDNLIVSQILPTPYDGADFPGYDNVRRTNL